MRNFLKFCLLIFLVLYFSACGYKPISKISSDVLGENVFVDVDFSKTDPKNSVYIKDNLNEYIVNRLSKNLVSDQVCDSKIFASIKSIEFTPLIYDQFGYVSAYKTTLRLNLKTIFKDGSTSDISVSGEYDFQITKKIKNVRSTDSVISDSQRYEAIRNSTDEALDEWISILALKAMKWQ